MPEPKNLMIAAACRRNVLQNFAAEILILNSVKNMLKDISLRLSHQ